MRRLLNLFLSFIFYVYGIQFTYAEGCDFLYTGTTIEDLGDKGKIVVSATTYALPNEFDDSSAIPNLLIDKSKFNANPMELSIRVLVTDGKRHFYNKKYFKTTSWSSDKNFLIFKNFKSDKMSRAIYSPKNRINELKSEGKRASVAIPSHVIFKAYIKQKLLCEKKVFLHNH